jgi:hypothetical protein
MRSADSGDLLKAVKMLERAARLHPGNELYGSKHKALLRQLDAVQAESERDQRERTADGNAGDGWSNGPSTDDADAREHARGSAEWDEPAAPPPRARFDRRTLTEQWSKLKALAFALLLTSPRWMGEWAVSWLPRDEDRAYRLTYLSYYWIGTLEVPLILCVIGLVCRLVYVFPWTVFFLVCVAAAPVGFLIGRAAGIKRRVLGGLVGAHLLFVYSCPTASAYLYCAVLWLACAAVFRSGAVLASSVLGFLWLCPWTALYLVLFAGWAMLMYCAPLPSAAASALLCFGCYFPLSLALVLSWLAAAVCAYVRAPYALTIAAAGTAAWWRPAYAPRVALLLALALALRWRAQLRELGAWLVGSSADADLPRPRDGPAAVAHVLGASTHYEVLALGRKASLAQIKSAYKRMALLLHPDKNQRAPRAARRRVRFCARAESRGARARGACRRV